MTLHDLERRRIENTLNAFIDRIRPPPHIRSELDFGFDIAGPSVKLVEIRPQWDDRSIIHRCPFAKATFVKTQGIWKIYWQRASGKWQSYAPTATVASIDAFLAVIAEDKHACFFG
jgi:hypothetical protein